MPRLLPRLLKALQTVRLQPTPISPRRRPQRRPLLLPQDPPQCPPISPEGRTQSIVLDSLDPILALSMYKRHKAPAPRLRALKSRSSQKRDHEAQVPNLRSMSEEERRYWASPYLRMLSTPLRRCFATKRYLPRAFLVRLAPVRLPGPLAGKATQILVPDGVEHPRFKPRKVGQGHYVLCWKAIIETLAERGSYRRLSSNMVMHSWLERHIAHILRLRVLQELHVLEERLRAHPEGAQEAPLLRRLTRAEWGQMKSSGVLPCENAIAVLVVPQLNRSVTTKRRPEPSMSAVPPMAEESSANMRSSLPISTVLRTTEEAFDEDGDILPSFLPQSKVPLYHGISLFPSRSHRATLHASLSRLLDIERRSRFVEKARKTAVTQTCGPTQCHPSDSLPQPIQSTQRARKDDKASHACVLCSDSNTLLRADTVPLAIALWRIRIWEGAGWGDSNEWILKST